MNQQILELQEEQDFLIPKSKIDNNTIFAIYSDHKERIEISGGALPNDHHYTLRSKGWVGCIPISDEIVIKINPKVTIENLFRMLEYAYNLKSFEFLKGVFQTDSLEELFDHLAAILAKRTLDRARKGLYRGYLKENQELPYIRGRVRVMPSLRAVLRGSTRLDCSYEENTPDVDENRILAWTLYWLPRFHIKREDVRNLVRQAYRAVASAVEVHPISAKDCIQRIYHRLNEDYQPMHSLCRFFLEHCGPAFIIGQKDFLPFVIHMPKLFESFVAEWLVANLPEEMSIEKHYRVELDEAAGVIFDIDLVLRNVQENRIIAVLDTKYKSSPKPKSEDIHQIIAYASSMKANHAFLVYPTSKVEHSNFTNQSRIHVQSLSFDIEKDPDKAGQEFLIELKKALVV